MGAIRGHLDLRPRRIAKRFVQELKLSPNYYFMRDVFRLIWAYKWFSLAIILVTIAQEFAALWPVSLLGQFVDRLQTGTAGEVVWLFLVASILAPAIVRANVILRHKMFYETDFQKTVELTLKVAEKAESGDDPEKVGAAYTRTLNAVSGITNATFYVLGSFTPIIIKIVVVSGSLLSYNRTLGLAYLGSLLIPLWMTVYFNRRLRVLLDAQYSVISETSGIGIRTISTKGDPATCKRFLEIMGKRKQIFISLVAKSQIFLHIRELALVGSQFLVIFLALGIREQINLTAGDFTKIVGYTTQVAAAFIGAASVVDAIISYSRAYHVYSQAHGH